MEILLLVLKTLIPLIVTALFGVFTASLKKTADTYKKGKITLDDETSQKIVDKVTASCKAEDKKLQEQINENREIQNLMMAGLLSVQGRQFKKHCRELLEPGHAITVEEYEEIINDHDAYNGLGGNHIGDMLFNAVVAKYESQV